METDLLAWIDVSAGVAGDMLLGALLDVGAPLASVHQAVRAVLVGEDVHVTTETVTRAGMRAAKVRVAPEVGSYRREWSEIRLLLEQAALPEGVRAPALAVFQRLAEAESRVHGISANEVHFHEVGAIDSIVDVVGTCAAMQSLVGVRKISASAMAVGSGRVRTAHGDLAVPVPAVAELMIGWTVAAGGTGELATPTGVALVTTLAETCEPLPAMRAHSVGVGAGDKDIEGRANVVRVLLGEVQESHVVMADAIELSANVDDLDPRVWPEVLDALLSEGAVDAWLVPVMMKKGRPAHVLHALCAPEGASRLRDIIVEHTSTIGVREASVRKFALPRLLIDTPITGGVVRVKITHRDGLILHATPEFDDARKVAVHRGIPVRAVLDEVVAAAAARGLRYGAPLALLDHVNGVGNEDAGDLRS